MGECFHCGSDSVIWDSDFSYSDMGYEGEGIVHLCHCSNCGAKIEYDIPLSSKNKKSVNRKARKSIHGEWVKDSGRDSYICSKCHTKFIICGRKPWIACPVCGIKMKLNTGWLNGK